MQDGAADDMTGTDPVERARAAASAATDPADLEAAVRVFDGCALSAGATNTVFADGAPSARVMLVGEAPGAREDREGRPFVGSAGRLLDEALAAADLPRPDRAYIANTVFWRPPNNRKPTADEIRTCLPFLERHIALAAPDVLVTLGGVPTKVLLDTNGGVTSLRGLPTTYANRFTERPIDLVPTLHPAFLLRQPARKRDLWHDLQLVRRLLDGNEASEPTS